MEKRLILIGTISLFLPFLFGCSTSVVNARSTEQLPHHTQEGFINPYLTPAKRGFFRYLKMRYFSDEEFADYETNAHKVPTIQADLQLINSPGKKPQVTWVGHATALVQYKGVSILTDPMFSDRASPVSFSGPQRVNPPALKIEELPPIDLVIISHNHYDHLDTQSVRQIGEKAFWAVPLRLKSWFIRQGIPEEKVMEFDWWDTHTKENVIVTATPAQHWSARSLWDRNETLWNSWMVQIGNFTFWYSGDTGYNPSQFKEIGTRFSRIDLGIISIGAYAPRWFMKDMHVNPEEAVQIHLDLRARQSLAVQWGSFPLTSEPIDEPPEKLRGALLEKGIASTLFSAMQIGETRIIDMPKTQ